MKISIRIWIIFLMPTEYFIVFLNLFPLFYIYNISVLRTRAGDLYLISTKANGEAWIVRNRDHPYDDIDNNAAYVAPVRICFSLHKGNELFWGKTMSDLVFWSSFQNVLIKNNLLMKEYVSEYIGKK